MADVQVPNDDPAPETEKKELVEEKPIEAENKPEVTTPVEDEPVVVKTEESNVDEKPAAEELAESGSEEEGEEAPQGERKVDDDLDRRNPQYIPKGGAFYEHDDRTADTEVVIDAEPDKKKKVWKESKTTERWLHDCYDEEEQRPKTKEELEDQYGYDIRNEENAPRARRRRKYGRGPDKYDRKWDDEQAYSQKGIKGRNPVRKRPEDFPPLPNQRNGETERTPPKPNAASWRGPRDPREVRQENRAHHQEPQMSKPKPRMEDNIKPFRNDSAPRKQQEMRGTPRGRFSDGRPQSAYHERDVSQLAEEMHNMSMQQRSSKLPDPREQMNADPNRNRQNPKRYSKISKGFYFPPEDIPELIQRDNKPPMEPPMPPTRQVSQQHSNQQRPDGVIVQGVNVLQRYSDSYNGNPTYLPGRTILQPMAQTSMNAPPPQMAPMDLPPQPSYAAPPPMYIDMSQGDVLPYQGFPYPQGQNPELYANSQPTMPPGITYYSPEIQTGVGPRALPLRRKAAIPIVPPPDTR